MSDLMELLLGETISLKSAMGEDVYDATKAQLGTVLAEKDTYLLTEKNGLHYLLSQGDTTELHIGLPEDLALLVTNMVNTADLVNPPKDALPLELRIYGEKIRADVPLSIPSNFGQTQISSTFHQVFEHAYQEQIVEYVKKDITTLKQATEPAHHPLLEALEENYISQQPTQSPYFETLDKKARASILVPEYGVSLFVPLSDLTKNMHTLKQIYNGLTQMAKSSPLAQILHAGKPLDSLEDETTTAQQFLKQQGYSFEEIGACLVLIDPQGNQTFYRAMPDGNELAVNKVILAQQISENLEQKGELLNIGHSGFKTAVSLMRLC